MACRFERLLMGGLADDSLVSELKTCSVAVKRADWAVEEVYAVIVCCADWHCLNSEGLRQPCLQVHLHLQVV